MQDGSVLPMVYVLVPNTQMKPTIELKNSSAELNPDKNIDKRLSDSLKKKFLQITTKDELN